MFSYIDSDLKEPAA